MNTRRSPKHCTFIRLLSCVGCGRRGPSECAHVRMGHFGGVVVPQAERGGTGLKPADRWTVPLCTHCHRLQHEIGERSFWEATELNPLALAQALWRNTGNLEAAQAIMLRTVMRVAI